MSTPFSVEPKRATTNVVMELSSAKAPPTLPSRLKDYVSPNTWEIRVSTLIRLASQYRRPTLERVYLAVILILTFLVPIATYYVAVEALQSNAPGIDKQIWFVRFGCIALTVAMWILLSAPMLIWKYFGKVRVKRLVELWTRTDALSAPTYGAAPVWKAYTPWMFGGTVVLMVTVPLIKKSNFDRDSGLPPYVSVGDDALPPYGSSSLQPIQWSKDLGGGIKYGDLPIYIDGKPGVA